MDKQTAIKQVRDGYSELLASVQGLDEPAMNKVFYGDWSVKDLLAHISGWHHEMTRSMERMARGEKPTPEGVSYADGDAWNAKFTENTTPGKASLAGWDAGFQEYVSAARALGEDQYGTDPASGKPRIGNRLLQGAGIGHLAEHREELDAWLMGRNG